MHRSSRLQLFCSIVGVTCLAVILSGCGDSSVAPGGGGGGGAVPAASAPNASLKSASGGRYYAKVVPAESKSLAAVPDGRVALKRELRGEGLSQAKSDVTAKLDEQAGAAGETYESVTDNPFHKTADEPLSTFSIDVDTASYCQRPPLSQPEHAAAARTPCASRRCSITSPIDDAPPPESSEHPFAVHVEVAGCPWNAEHRLARIGIAARPIDQSRRPPSNLVFLVDVSGLDGTSPTSCRWSSGACSDWSSSSARTTRSPWSSTRGPRAWCCPRPRACNKAEITVGHRAACGPAARPTAARASSSPTTSPPRTSSRTGPTASSWPPTAISTSASPTRTSWSELIEAKAKSGVFLSVLGFGMGNIKDGKLEKLADKGNGHYAYIDSPREAYKVLVEEMGSTLVTVAKDVKIQVEFNPAKVGAFRLIGYENRIMAHQDFNDDTKDAGEIGAGHHVTALYELVPAGQGRWRSRQSTRSSTRSRPRRTRRATSRSPSSFATSGPTATRAG